MLAAAVFLLQLVWMQVASAQCSKTATRFPLNGSDFAADYNVTASNATRTCFQVRGGRECDVSAGLCCLGKASSVLVKYTSVMFALSNVTGCLLDPATMKKTVKWSANGKTKKAKIVGANVTVAVGVLAATPVTLCADFLAGFTPGCGAMKKLCDGTQCKVFLQLSKVTKKPDPLNQATWTTGVSCCLSGQADLNTCDVDSQRGCGGRAACTASVVEGAARGVCTCPAGLQGNAYANCTDIDECATGNGSCHPKAVCANTDGSRTCLCSAGYTGDGVSCTDVNECAANNGGCHAKAVCNNTEGGRTCTCKQGFSGDGVASCIDVNECANNGGCHADAVCNNTEEGRTCTCKPGYSGDGVLICTDINECSTNNGGCGDNSTSTCTNTVGGFTCSCKPGFQSVGGICIDAKACANNGGCAADAVCSLVGGGPTCACKAGFTGDGITCTDVNECAVGNGGCDANAFCNNTDGGYSCNCKPGYAGNGTNCADVNECADFLACDPDAACNNTIGSFTCTCKPGFATIIGADGIICAYIDPCTINNGGCHHNADCSTDGPRSNATCACKAGFVGDGIFNCTGPNVRCWGVGDNDQQSEIPPAVTTAVGVYTGPVHTCSVLADGLVLCFGDNSSGQLGVPANVLAASVALPVGALGLTPAATCVLTKAGAVQCFGDTAKTEGTTAVPAALQVAGSAVGLSGGDGFMCAVKTGGGVVCWGSAVVNATAVPADLAAAGAATPVLSSSGSDTCVVTTQGTVRCFGEGTQGELDAPPGLTLLVHVCTSGVHACAAQGDGTVACWGENDLGQAQPPADLTDAVMVACGDRFTVALTSAGVVRMWGLAPVYTPEITVPSDLSAAKSVSARGRYICVVLDGGPDECQLNTDNCHPNATCTDTDAGFKCTCNAGFIGNGIAACALDTACATGTASCHADAKCTPAIGGHACICKPGYFGDGVVSCTKSPVRCWERTNDPAIILVPSMGPVKTVAAAKRALFACAVRANDSKVQCWGRNDNLQLDVPLNLGPVKELSVGGATPCALTAGGAVRCWGNRGDIPPSSMPSELAANGSTKAISVGAEHACALKADGSVAVWGANPPSAEAALQVAGAAKSVSCGDGNVCIITPPGFLQCYGDDSYGQSTVPDALLTLNFTAVSAGLAHTCGVLVDSTVKCFGTLAVYDNIFNTPDYVPADLGPVKMVSAGFTASGAVTAAGVLVVFPETGPIGSIAEAEYGPVPGDLGTVVAVTLGDTQACAIVVV